MIMSKKLFWALWGGSFIHEKLTKEQIEQYQGLAKTIHNRRLASLYVSPDLGNNVVLSNKEVENIINLAQARLGYEKCFKGLDLDKPNVELEKS